METTDMKPPTRFTGENYTTWAFRFEQWMQWKDLWNVFTSNPPGDEETEDIKATWKRKNAQGYSALTLSIGEDELHAIREFKDKVNSSKLSWEILRARCVQKSHLHRLDVRNQLGDLRMEVGEPLEKYLTRCEEVRRLHKEYDVDLMDLDYVWAILRGLPQDWSLVIMTLQPDQNEWTLDNILARLRQEELRRTKLAGDSAFFVRRQGGRPTSMRGKGKGIGQKHVSPKQKESKEKGPKPQMAASTSTEAQVRIMPPGMQPKGVCHYCKKGGHMWRFCNKRPQNWIPEFLRNKEKGKNNPHSYNGYTKDQKREFSMIVTTSERALSVATPKAYKQLWFLDSGCTSHMTPLRHVFHTFKPVNGQRTVTVGNEAQLPVLGEGTVILQGPKGNLLKVRRVLFVPELMCSLLSVRSMTSNGHAAHFDNDGVTIIEKDTGTIAATATVFEDMYQIDATPMGPRTLGLLQKTTTPSLTANEQKSCKEVGLYMSEGGKQNVHGTVETWHQRLSHVGKDTIRLMVKRQLVDGIKLLDDVGHSKQCTSCVEGKMVKGIFPLSDIKTFAPLELVHSDIMGPMRTSTRMGANYVITIVDDFSRYSWVFLVKRRSDFSNAFLRWWPTAERQCGTQLKTLRSDRGGEYMAWNFQAQLSKRGVQHQPVVPYNPQQNGVAERYNRTLMDGARSLLANASLREKWWGDAVLYTSWTRNRIPHASLKNHISPHEKIWGKRPDLSLARVFGCMAQVLVPAHKLAKTESRALWAMFVGIEEGTKGWRFWNIDDQKDFVSRDATFYETLFINDWHHRRAIQTCKPLPTVEDLHLSSTLDDTGRGPTTKRAPQPNQCTTPERVETPSRDGDKDAASNTVSSPVEDVQEIGRMQDLLMEQLRSPTRSTESTSSSERRYPLRERRQRVLISLNAKDLKLPMEPQNWKEAMEGPDTNGWMAAAMDEWKALEEQGVFEKVDLPPDKNVLDTKWVFKVKTKGDGTFDRFKMRLVARGFRQVFGLDYNETFAPVGKYTTARALLAVATAREYEIHQMDISNAFLHGDLEEEVYMTQPEGFEDGTNKVLKLKKSLYGLKQSPRCWNKALHQVLIDNHFKQSSADPSLYVLHNKKDPLWMLVYVDDLLIVSPSLPLISTIKNVLQENFKIKDLGEATYYLGMNINRNKKRGEMWLSHSKYATQVVDRYKLNDGNPSPTPLPADFKVHADDTVIKGEDDERLPSNQDAIRQTKQEVQLQRAYQSKIGSLMFTAICIRPDLSFATGQLAQAAQCPQPRHEAAIKRTLRYLAGTTTSGLHYSKVSTGRLVITGYSDSDWAGCTKTRKSISGWIFFLCGAAISWQSKKQSVVAMSSCEAEYIALSSASREAVWLRRLLHDLGEPQNHPTMIKVDNTSAIALARNPEFHARTKHIQLHYHYIRQAMADGEVDVEHCRTNEQVADGLTKVLSRDKHNVFVQECGIEQAAA